MVIFRSHDSPMPFGGSLQKHKERHADKGAHARGATKGHATKSFHARENILKSRPCINYMGLTGVFKSQVMR